MDGVLLVAPERWDVHLERDLGIAPAHIQNHFFKTVWSGCALGTTDTREAMRQCLALLGRAEDAEEVLTYWHVRDSHPNTALQPLMQELQGAIPRHFIATNQDRYRWTHLKTHVVPQMLAGGIEKAFISAEMGRKKPEADFFAHIERETGLSGPELLFIDDAAENTRGAAAMGWQVHTYTDLENFAPLAQQLLR